MIGQKSMKKRTMNGEVKNRMRTLRLIETYQKVIHPQAVRQVTLTQN